MAKMTDKERKNLLKLINILKENPTGLWIRELSRQSKLHMEISRRLIQKYPQIFEEYADFTPYKINLKLIKLKNENISEKNLDLAIEL
ncbi:MAG: hypothetical protein K0B07_03540 [DPANN group archaeon]|nr:hypothetical protein [DPANN group archaeon]